MYMLPLLTGAVEYLSGKPCPHGTLLGLIPPTAVNSLFHSIIIYCFISDIFSGVYHSQGFRYEMAMERESHTF